MSKIQQHTKYKKSNKTRNSIRMQKSQTNKQQTPTTQTRHHKQMQSHTHDNYIKKQQITHTNNTKHTTNIKQHKQIIYMHIHI